jgi:copper chaperone CopZ
VSRRSLLAAEAARRASTVPPDKAMCGHDYPYCVLVARREEPSLSRSGSMCDIQTAYVLEGMTSQSCASKVATAVKAVDGVTGTSVDLSTGSLMVSGHPTEASVRAAIESVGYSMKAAV